MVNHASWIAEWPKCPRSAYSASPPVTSRKTAPSTINPRPGSSAKNRIAGVGSTAPSTDGLRMMLFRPSSLPEIVEHQRRQRDGEPRELDRRVAEVPKVRIQCFAAGDGQEDGAEHDQSR